MSVDQKYRKLDEVEHVLARPGMYVGNTETTKENLYIPDEETGEYTLQSVEYNPAFLKLFDEIVTNAVDESKRGESSLDAIKVTLPETEQDPIVVEDNGGIPVQVHSEHNQYVPEMIFSELRAGSNFNDEDDRTGAGLNGLGSVLTNIFSKKFVINTCDGVNKFTQTFQDNLGTRKEPKVTQHTKAGTRITYYPDYESIGCRLDEGNRKVLVKRVYDIAGTNPNLKVSINKSRIKINSFKDYIKLYTDDFCYDEQERWSVGIAPSEDGFQSVSFVNSTDTPQGTHVDYVVNQIVDEIREHIQKKKKVNIKPAEIKKNIKLFLNCEIYNPQFSSQTKEKLITQSSHFPTSYTPDQRFINRIIKSSVIERIMEWIDAKQKAEEAKKRKEKEKESKKKKVPKYIHANADDRENCILFLAEGDSASNMFLPVRDQDYHGMFPLSGKPLNVYDKKEHEVLENKEMSGIINVLGLEFDEEPNDLNYGYVALCTDEDYDGWAIQALLINFFYKYWPSLIENGQVLIYHSPIMVAKKDKQVKTYYSFDEYYADLNNLKGWDVQYKKGLGSLEEDDYHNMIYGTDNVEVLTMDDAASTMMEMAFGNDSEKRKVWLKND